MLLSQIRTKSEKILFPIAVVFSVAVWLAIVGMPFLSLFQEKKPVEPCFLTDIFEDGTEELYDVAMDDAISGGYEADCLAKEEVDPDTYEQVRAELMSEESFRTLIEKSPGYIAIFYILSFYIFMYFFTAIAMAHIRLNGVKLGEKQYSQFYKIYHSTANELEIKHIPDAYIIHAAGELNAFAIKIARKRMVVFYAELLETLIDAGKLHELHAVSAHELTHVKLRHIYYHFFLLPFNIVPFLGKMLSRAREYSADRGALYICNNLEVVTQALVKLIVGKMVAKEVDVEEYIANSRSERGFFVWIAKKIATHPPIPKRIQALQNTFRQGNFSERVG